MSLSQRILPALILGLTMSASPGRALAATVPATPFPSADSARSVETTAASAPQFFRSLQTSFDATVASRYLFQGIDYSDGRSVLQPDLVISHGPYSAVVWGNYQPNLGDVNEVDLSLKVTRSFGRLTASPGYTSLRYPNRVDWSPSQEGFVDLALAAPFSPTLSVHYDFDAGDGAYATFGLSRAVGASLSLASNVFYQHRYYGMTGFPAAELKVSTAFPYGSFLLAPSLSRFVSPANGDFTAAARVPAGWLLSLNFASKP